MYTFYSVGLVGHACIDLDMSKGALAVAVTWWLTGSNYIQRPEDCFRSGPNTQSFSNSRAERGEIPASEFSPMSCHGESRSIGDFRPSDSYYAVPTLAICIAFIAPLIAAFLYPQYALAYFIFTIVLILMQHPLYSRVKEMHKCASGKWRHVAGGKILKDRL
jgi:hypothetical protein